MTQTRLMTQEHKVTQNDTDGTKEHKVTQMRQIRQVTQMRQADDRA
jgi:hypothetical protein